MNARRIARLAIPLAVVLVLAGFITGLELQRGPDWRLELDAYLADHQSPSQPLRVETVVRARRPWNFGAVEATAASDDWPWGDISSSSPPQAVRCALLVEGRPPETGAASESTRRIVYLVHHSDALYRVGWLAYEGPQAPFSPQTLTHLQALGCDLSLR